MYTIDKQLIIEKFETIKKFVESRGGNEQYFRNKYDKKVTFDFIIKWNLWIYVVEQDQLSAEIDERKKILNLAEQKIKKQCL